MDEKELGMFLDEFQEEFYSYDNSNAELPIVPKFSEKYDVLNNNIRQHHRHNFFRDNV